MRKIRILFAGDYLNSSGKEDFLSEELKNIISTADIAICNFEGPIDHPGKKPIKKAGPHIYHHKDSVKFLKKAGFNMVSIANNHIYDFGQLGLYVTIEELNRNDIRYVGAGLDFEKAYKPLMIEMNGIKIGFIAGCENEFGCLYEYKERGGYAWLLHPIISDNIDKLRQECDFVVLIAHAGVEDVKIPIKEWRDLYRYYCYKGVDLIVGHHPHVPQGYEEVRGKAIFYSLGDFYFDAHCGASYDESFSVLVDFYIDNKRLKYFEYSLIYHKKNNDGKIMNVQENEVSFNIKELNSLLGDSYEELNSHICKELFYDRYKMYYELAVGKFPDSCSFWDKAKLLTKKIIKKYILKRNVVEIKNLLLLHNIKIDSHRFVTIRALETITGIETK